MVYYNARCYFCNLFMSYDDMENSSIRWTPYGGYLDLEPPDDEWAHLQCWTNLEEKRRLMIQGLSWNKPYIQEDGEGFPAYCVEEKDGAESKELHIYVATDKG